MKVYPLKFRPIFKERIWGGRELEKVYGKELPPGVKIGESWELADLPGDKSEIVNGPLAGETIDRVIARFGQSITGTSDYEPPFPLLIKILDAQDVLSVQVHPDLETCRRTGKGAPKTECWYIIAAAPGAVIYKGLKDGVTREDLERAVRDGTTAEMLNKVRVRVGECHFLPSGTAHAIGEGLLIAEIQQPSDTTYRLFDWNRLKANGNGGARELHIAEAMESIHFNCPAESLTVKTTGRLVDADVFKVDKGRQERGSKVRLQKGWMEVYIVISGGGEITDAGIEPVRFVRGDTMLKPADFEGEMAFAEDTEYLVAATG